MRFFGLFFLSVALVPAVGSAEVYRECKLLEMLGDGVSIERGDTTFSASVGTAVEAGDKLSTGAGAYAVVHCADIQVSLGENSVFVLGAAEAGKETVSSGLLSGIVGLIQGRLRRPHRVETSRLVAAVRSTEWVVTAGAEKDSVFVREGIVQVSNGSGNVVDLAPGQGVDIAGDSQTLTAQAWGPARIKAVVEQLPIGW